MEVPLRLACSKIAETSCVEPGFSTSAVLPAIAVAPFHEIALHLARITDGVLLAHDVASASSVSGEGKL